MGHSGLCSVNMALTFHAIEDLLSFTFLLLLNNQIAIEPIQNCKGKFLYYNFGTVKEKHAPLNPTTLQQNKGLK